MKKLFLIIAALMLIVFAAAPPAMAAGTPAGTAITNQAYADYKDTNGNAMPRVFSNTVTTVVQQVAGVTTAPTTMANNAVAGTNIAYPVTITNTGNGTDTFPLAASVTAGTGTVTIYRDDNGDGIWQPTETTIVSSTGALPADGTFKVFAVVAVPPGAANGSTITVTLTGTSTFNGSVSAVSTLTTTVQAAVLAASKSAVDPASNTTLVTTAKPGDIITYMITVANTGAPGYDLVYTDVIPANTTYVAGSMKAGLSASYNTAPRTITDANDGNEFSPDGGTTQVGAYFDSANNRIVLNKSQHPPQGNFYFKVRVNDNVPAGTVISNSFTVDYALVAGSATRYSASSNTSTVTVAQQAGILLDPDRTGFGNTGDQIVYAFTATNRGNNGDTIDLTINSTAGWSWVIWKDADGNGIPGTGGDVILTDTNGNGRIDTGVLAQGASVPLLAVATIPAGTANGTVDTTTIIGTSAFNPAVTDPQILTTTVRAPVLSITKGVTAVQAPGGGAVCTPTNTTNGSPCNVVPGSVLTYTVTVTNSGGANATTVVITDVIPQYTTYKAGSIKTGSSIATLASRTDARDGDTAEFNSSANAVVVPDGGTLTIGPSGGTWVLQFQVTVN